MNATSSTIRVVVVEDQPAVLKNQLKILQEAAGIEVIGTALSGEAALELLEKKQPDVILQDLGLPRMTGIEVTREVKKRWPDRAVIASLMVDTRERWHEFMKRSADSGADGVELNFGCPHGMCERGMGCAIRTPVPSRSARRCGARSRATCPAMDLPPASRSSPAAAGPAAPVRADGRRQRHGHVGLRDIDLERRRGGLVAARVGCLEEEAIRSVRVGRRGLVVGDAIVVDVILRDLIEPRKPLLQQ